MKPKLITSSLLATALAVVTALPAQAMPIEYSGSSSETTKQANGFVVRNNLECKPTATSSIDLCDKSLANAIKKQLKTTKSRFGKNSVLFKKWDADNNYWVYFAVNKKTNTIHPYGLGVAKEGDSPSAGILYKSKAYPNLLCTKGEGTILQGDGVYHKTYGDLEDDTDYCVSYFDEHGFDLHYAKDVATNEIVDSFYL